MLTPLAKAEEALERGDYQQCLLLLEPLAKEQSAIGKEGSKIRMLMVTAFMGQGEDQKAISTCRLLSRCKDPELRQQAKQLISILEAPSLERPSNWSIQLPSLKMSSTGEVSYKKKTSHSLKPESHPLPPTGPTKGLGIGFSILVIVVLTGLTILLSE